MSRRSRYSATLWPSHPFSMWTKLATQSTEMMLASSQVIAKRSQRMASMGANPAAADRREMNRMVDEKVDAASESVQAMATRASGLYQASVMQWFDLVTRQTASLYGIGKPPRVNAKAAANKTMHAAMQITSAGMAPFHRRATGNAKRLRKQP